MSSKNIFRILINTAIGAVLIFFWLKLVDIKEVIITLSQVSLFVLPIPILLFLLGSFFRSYRLKILLSQFKIPVRNLWFLNMISQLLSYMIPIRAGELAKAVYLSTSYDLPTPKAIVYVFIDRFLDFILTVLISLTLLLFIPTNLPVNLKPTLAMFATIVTAVTLLFILMPGFCKKIIDIISHILIIKPLKKLLRRLGYFIVESVGLLKKGTKESAAIIILTVLALITDAAAWYVVFGAVSKILPDFIKIQLGSLLSSLTYLIPAAPGYVGSAEASGLAVFSFGMGMDKNLVSATTVLIHISTLLYMLIFGLIALYVLKFNLHQVWKKFKK